MSTPTLSIIVPCFNEEASLPALAARLAKLRTINGLLTETVLVDDGSTDGTWGVLEQLAAQYPWALVAKHTRNLGLPAAWHTGLERARGGLVCLLDADLQYRPEDIARLHRLMFERQVDLVQGARRWTQTTPATRFVLSRATSALLNSLFAMRLTDNKSGFILCKREVLARLLADRTKYDYFQLLLMVAAHSSAVPYANLEVDFEPRRQGSSFLAAVPVVTMARALIDVGRAVVDYRLKRRPR